MMLPPGLRCGAAALHNSTVWGGQPGTAGGVRRLLGARRGCMCFMNQRSASKQCPPADRMLMSRILRSADSCIVSGRQGGQRCKPGPAATWAWHAAAV